MDIIIKILAFLVLLSVVVAIHELGHFLVARFFKIRVEIFALGFGRELFGYNDRYGTRWKFCAIPLGGYVKMFGDGSEASNPDFAKIKKMSKKEKREAFYTKSLWVKSLVVIGGPLSNFLLCILLLAGMFYFVGKVVTIPKVSEVVVGSRAEQAGVKAGDIIISIDGEKLSSYGDIARIVSLRPNEELTFKIDRSGENFELMITPELVESEDPFGNKVKVGRVGIISEKGEYMKLSLVESLEHGVTETYVITKSTLFALKQMVVGTRGLEDLGGPIRIAKYSGQSTDLGLLAFLWLIAVVSANLGLVNLLPVPALDGGHLLNYAIEGVRGEPLSEAVQMNMFKVGVFLLLLLVLISTINDLKFIGLF